MKKQTRLLQTAKTTCACLFWIGVWYVFAFLVDKAVVLPYPHKVVARLLDLVVQGAFWQSTGLSLIRVFLGFAFGIVLGVLFAVAAHRFSLVDRLLFPLITTLRATPVASFIILLLVLMNRVQIPSFIAILMVLPVVYANLRAGLSKIDVGLQEVTTVYGFSFGKKLQVLYLPSLAPFFISASRTSLGLAWKAGIAAEVLCATKKSIGVEILDSKTYLETEQLFAWTLVVIVLSLVLEKGMLRLVGALEQKWHLAAKGETQI